MKGLDISGLSEIIQEITHSKNFDDKLHEGTMWLVFNRFSECMAKNLRKAILDHKLFKELVRVLESSALINYKL
jgi:hypothetical protein